MNEHFEQNSSSEPQQVEPDLLTLVKKIQQHLVYLEKKIDTLMGQSSGGFSSDRPSRGRNFSKPFRPFNRSRQHGEGGNRDDRPRRDRGFGHDRPSFGGDRPRGGESRGGESRGSFGASKKPFFRRRRD